MSDKALTLTSANPALPALAKAATGLITTATPNTLLKFPVLRCIASNAFNPKFGLKLSEMPEDGYLTIDGVRVTKTDVVGWNEYFDDAIGVVNRMSEGFDTLINDNVVSVKVGATYASDGEFKPGLIINIVKDGKVVSEKSEIEIGTSWGDNIKLRCVTICPLAVELKDGSTIMLSIVTGGPIPMRKAIQMFGQFVLGFEHSNAKRKQDGKEPVMMELVTAVIESSDGMKHAAVQGVAYKDSNDKRLELKFRSK